MKQEMMGWQWHQLDHMQVMPAPYHSIFIGQMLFLRPTNSVKALKANIIIITMHTLVIFQVNLDWLVAVWIFS